MRHLRSILYALALAPAAWLLIGAGLAGPGRDGVAPDGLSGLCLLLLAGLAYGILVLGPISPAGPCLAGFGYLMLGGWALLSPASYATTWATDSEISEPLYGFVVLLAVPLLGTGLSVRRWQEHTPPVLPMIGTIGPFGNLDPADPEERLHLFDTFGDPGERTQVVSRPRASMEVTHVVVPPAGEKTQVVVAPAGEAGEKTQVVVPPAGEAGEKTQVVVPPAGNQTQTGDVGGDETKVIRWSGSSGSGELTQVIPVDPVPDREAEPSPSVRTHERAPDEEDHDVAAHLNIPAQRRSTEDD